MNFDALATVFGALSKHSGLSEEIDLDERVFDHFFFLSLSHSRRQAFVELGLYIEQAWEVAREWRRSSILYPLFLKLMTMLGLGGS